MSAATVMNKAKLIKALPPPAERRAIRERAGLTQQDFGDALGVDRATVCRWEAGRRPERPHLGAYVRLLQRLR
ncbi:MAG: helix-turn-helix domain-containing protein, partial [Acidimicrobiales bacterium]